ncbi:MAG: hypothetical protein WBA87_02180 [Microbacterium sp.]
MTEIKEGIMREVDQDFGTLATTPEAVEATRIRNRRRDTILDPASYRVRGVDWVRPTDLMARSGSQMAGAGINFQAELLRRTRKATTTSIRGIAQRARRLPLVSAFGHGTSRSGTERGAVGAV